MLCTPIYVIYITDMLFSSCDTYLSFNNIQFFHFFLMTVVYMMGAIYSTKIFGNFGSKLNGSLRSNRKSFEKTGPPFEVGHFSRSDWSEFWLNGSHPISPYKALMSKIAKSYPLFHLDLRGRKLICTVNMTIWSVKYCGPERRFEFKTAVLLFHFFFLRNSLVNI